MRRNAWQYLVSKWCKFCKFSTFHLNCLLILLSMPASHTINSQIIWSTIGMDVHMIEHYYLSNLLYSMGRFWVVFSQRSLNLDTMYFCFFLCYFLIGIFCYDYYYLHNEIYVEKINGLLYIFLKNRFCPLIKKDAKRSLKILSSKK